MPRPSNILISTVVRNQRYRGPTSSAQQNDLQAELVRDITEVRRQWNTFVVSAFKLLPDGTDDPLVDAINNGIDGRTLYVNTEASLTSDNGQYFQSVRNRPHTIYEQFQDVYSTIDEQFETLESQIENTGGTGITAAQQAAIGINVFDGALTSSPSSIDGRSQSNTLNVLQLSRDLYGSAYASFSGDGDPVLSLSLRDMVGALLTLHSGTWNSDVTLAHSFTAADITTGTMSQERIGPSSSSGTGISDTYSGATTHLVHDLNIIRTQIRNLKDSASPWTNAISLNANWLPVTSALRPRDLKLTTDLKGSVARTDTNPWGYSYTDIDGLSAILSAEETFTGRVGSLDVDPAYSTVYGFSQGASLTTAVGALAFEIGGIVSDLLSTDTTSSGHIVNVNNPHSTTLTQAAAAGGSAPATQVTIVDNLGYYVATTAEIAFQEAHQRLLGVSGLIQPAVDDLETSLLGIIDDLDTDLSSEILALSGFLVAVDSGLENQIDAINATVSGIELDIVTIETSTTHRRAQTLVTALADDASVLVVHNSSMYPQVSVITVSNLTTAGYDAYNVLPVNNTTGILIEHTDTDSFYLTNKLGEELVSGLVVINW
jgi:hypothetical protein